MKIRKASGAAAGAAASTGALDGAAGLASTILKPITDIFNNLTNAIAGSSINRNNNSAANLQSYWNNRTELKKESNMGFYIIMGLVVLAAIIAIIVKSPKSK